MGPDETLLREWLHVAPQEDMLVEWGNDSARVTARGMEWLVGWDDDGEVTLDGTPRNRWSFELRRWRAQHEPPTTVTESEATPPKRGRKKP